LRKEQFLPIPIARALIHPRVFSYSWIKWVIEAPKLKKNRLKTHKTVPEGAALPFGKAGKHRGPPKKRARLTGARLLLFNQNQPINFLNVGPRLSGDRHL
jgi:hypothetical protein